MMILTKMHARKSAGRLQALVISLSLIGFAPIAYAQNDGGASASSSAHGASTTPNGQMMMGGGLSGAQMNSGNPAVNPRVTGDEQTPNPSVLRKHVKRGAAAGSSRPWQGGAFNRP